MQIKEDREREKVNSARKNERKYYVGGIGESCIMSRVSLII